MNILGVIPARGGSKDILNKSLLKAGFVKAVGSFFDYKL